MAKRKVGSIRELPNGRLEASVAVGFRVDGSPRRRYATFDGRDDAEAWVARTAVELGRSPALSAGRTLATLWSAYEAERRGRLANSTLDRYECCMRLHVLPALGGEDVSHITVPMVQSMIDGVPGRVDARQCKAALSSVLTWAERHGILPGNPIRSAHFSYPGDEGREWEDESVWDDDPFAAIEGVRDVWGAQTALEAFDRMRGLPLEPLWLLLVGGGLRLEEGFAIRAMDVRGTVIKGVAVTQVAVHHADNRKDGRHRTKSRKSVRVVALLEPFGARVSEIVCDMYRSAMPEDMGDARAVAEAERAVARTELCGMSRQNYGKRWRGYFAEPSTSKHAPRKEGCNNLGRLRGLRYIPLSRMRATHESLCQEAGVLDSTNARMHGHSERVSYSNYQNADATVATIRTSEYLRVVS